MKRVAFFFRKSIKWLSIITNLVLAVLCLLSSYAAYVSPQTNQWIPLLALWFPYLFIMVLLSALYWLMVKPIWVLLPIATLVASIPACKKTFAFNLQPKTITGPAITIATWNVHSLTSMSKSLEKRKLAPQEILQALDNTGADIICLQEFNSSQSNNHIKFFSTLYPYHFFSKDHIRENDDYAAGCIIFSKHPIAKTGKRIFAGKNAESVIFADVALPNTDTLRVFTTHLQSFKFKERDYLKIEKITAGTQEGMEHSKGIIKKLQIANTKRAAQAVLVAKFVRSSPYRTIVCGDFNDVPTSYTYATIAENFQDAFLQQSFGIGRTYQDLAPSLRIDYTLVHPTLTVSSFQMKEEGLSDHSMLITKILLK
ncbi:MAG: hypothetical protein EAZ47_04295 [Bacteroidetes bacterium]|nr:MAG: hypothetical protein EAY72_08640 [Bacteroidota bacterium]TAE72593.1 MAG: hypothetical protein EAY68_00880 [Bacteroidota bacterium]TAF94238.1 MAG: hypothetical protein EAZ47_04295 [Bacteroidota bacterium]